MLAVIEQRRASRLESFFQREANTPPEELANLQRFTVAFERGLVQSINKFAPLEGENRAAAGEITGGICSARWGYPAAGSSCHRRRCASLPAQSGFRRDRLRFGPIVYFNLKVAPEVRSSLKIFHVASLGHDAGRG